LEPVLHHSRYVDADAVVPHDRIANAENQSAQFDQPVTFR
jgi:hypothetical protein